MWYVIQVRSGEEQEIKEYIEHTFETDLCSVILPLVEDVWRKDGIGHISIKRLFPGYLFIETEQPEEVYRSLRKVPHFTRLLHMDEEGADKTFTAISREDEAFIESLTEDGLMRVSYVRKTRNGRIEEIRGPLSRYANKIVKLDIPHRRAIVESEIFGKHRRIKYPLWTDADPVLPRINDATTRENVSFASNTYDIGIKPGDKVHDESGIYGDTVFTVIKVDAVRRLVQAEAEMFGTRVHFEMNADNVGKIQR